MNSEERARRWASTMGGYRHDGTPGAIARNGPVAPDASPVHREDHDGQDDRGGHRANVRFAHADSSVRTGSTVEARPLPRRAREEAEAALAAPGATLASGAGNRARPEEPDEWRTCFERDRDRILHAPSFRRLAGKTQVFVFPDDHQRTRLTHALEVAQVAGSVARACGLNVALTEAIALGHDCGHGPGGHASEDALAPFLPEGFDHAPWGADVSLAGLNLCEETLDGIRNHSWSRPAPSTPEGEVVSWADRIAYVCHDFEDAVTAGIVTPAVLPEEVRAICGERRGRQLGTFIDGLVDTINSTGRVGMTEELAGALAAFRSSNYELVYLRPSSVAQGQAVISVLRALVERYADQPNLIPAGQPETETGGEPVTGGTEQAVRAAVAYVAGMTDRFAFRQAVAICGWDPAKLPRGVGTAGDPGSALDVP